jgi:hypothetical protein
LIFIMVLILFFCFCSRFVIAVIFFFSFHYFLVFTVQDFRDFHISIQIANGACFSTKRYILKQKR